MTGARLREVIEQGLTLERGMIQVSGMRIEYDPARPEGDRAVAIEIGGEPLEADRSYRVATNSFVAEGGDLYTTFAGLPWSQDTGMTIAEVVIEYLQATTGPIAPPERDASSSAEDSSQATVLSGVALGAESVLDAQKRVADLHEHRVAGV